MTIKDVMLYLAQNKINPYIVYTGVGIEYDRYAILESDGLWQVYYTERGQKILHQRFQSEDAACEYLLNLLKGDNALRP